MKKKKTSRGKDEDFKPSFKIATNFLKTEKPSPAMEGLAQSLSLPLQLQDKCVSSPERRGKCLVFSSYGIYIAKPQINKILKSFRPLHHLLQLRRKDFFLFKSLRALEVDIFEIL